MRLEKLALNNFRNYTNASVEFNADIICIVGENGAGKTNLIDAIYYLALTKSALNNVDSQNIRHGEEYFFLKASVRKQQNSYNLLLALGKGKKKVIKVNDVEYEKISDHIGKYPVVLIAPDDVSILLGGSEERRKFFDGTLAQTDQQYLSDLLSYNRYLKQRNSALKKFAESGKTDHALLDLYDDKLISFGKKIAEVRKKHLQAFFTDFKGNYALISDEKEEVEINYLSDFRKEGASSFKQCREKDVILQRTTWGIHKDDFEFVINEMPVKKFASQGQRKSFLTALKIAQFDYISREKGFKPLLLLDDIFDKLDDKRISHLLGMISENRFGQTFFTDARSEYTQQLFIEKNINFQLIKVEDGKIIKSK
jgi:DNA replication and repair protein RecF